MKFSIQFEDESSDDTGVNQPWTAMYRQHDDGPVSAHDTRSRRRRRVLNLLPADLDIQAWRQAFEADLVPDLTPYGYHHAERHGYDVVYPTVGKSTHPVGNLLNRIAWKALGFDLLHVWRNRGHLIHTPPDAVWTHTEREFLAFLLLRRIGLVPQIPVVAQTVWLADEWPRIGRLRRCLFDWLIRDADVCTFLSPLNESFARRMRWGRRTQVVEFGISMDSFPLQAPRRLRRPGPIRVLAVGNDRHRDWPTLHRAFAGDAGFEVSVASRTFPSDLLCANITAKTYTQSELREAYAHADVVVVPLQDHLHASGITVICEAVAMGRPVVASRAGGLTHYFTDDHIDYVAVGDGSALASSVRRVADNLPAACARTVAAQRRLLDRELTSAGYARRHVEITNALLSSRRGARYGISAAGPADPLRTPTAPS